MTKYSDYYNQENRADLGSQIMLLRERKEITQTDLAKKLGISQSNLSLIEKGERPITLEQLLKVADILETDLDHLVTGTSAKNTGLAGTGLSNDSIEILRELYKTADQVKSRRALYALNTLIRDKAFLSCLGQYLQKDFDQNLTVWTDEHGEITFPASDVMVPPFPFFEIDFEKAARLSLLEYLTVMRESVIEEIIEESKHKRGRRRKEQP